MQLVLHLQHTLLCVVCVHGSRVCCVPCVRRYQRQLKDMKEQVKEAEAREQEVIKKKRMAVSSTGLCPHTFQLI